MFCALQVKISGERLQDQWSSGFILLSAWICFKAIKDHVKFLNFWYFFNAF